jgi:hypothetical protein
VAANEKKLASICLVNARSTKSSLYPLSYMMSNMPAFRRTASIPLSFRAGKGLLLLQRAKQRQYGLKRASVMRISNENLVESVIWRPYRACIIGLGVRLELPVGRNALISLLRLSDARPVREIEILDVLHPRKRLLRLACTWEVLPMLNRGYHTSPVCDPDKKLRVCRRIGATLAALSC